MTRRQLAALCRSIERQHIVEVASHTGSRFCGIPERVRIDLSAGRVFGEVIIRSSGGGAEAIGLADIAAVRCLPCSGEA